MNIDASEGKENEATDEKRLQIRFQVVHERESDKTSPEQCVLRTSCKCEFVWTMKLDLCWAATASGTEDASFFVIIFAGLACHSPPRARWSGRAGEGREREKSAATVVIAALGSRVRRFAFAGEQKATE